jgi:hypothetical protein
VVLGADRRRSLPDCGVVVAGVGGERVGEALRLT